MSNPGRRAYDPTSPRTRSKTPRKYGPTHVTFKSIDAFLAFADRKPLDHPIWIGTMEEGRSESIGFTLNRSATWFQSTIADGRLRTAVITVAYQDWLRREVGRSLPERLEDPPPARHQRLLPRYGDPVEPSVWVGPGPDTDHPDQAPGPSHGIN